MNEQFQEQHKKVILKLSDGLSTDLKMNLCFDELKLEEKNYDKFEAAVPEFAYIGLIDNGASANKIITVIEPDLVAKFCHLAFGGDGQVNSEGYTDFTCSEQFVAHDILDRYLFAFGSDKHNLTVGRVDHRLELFHTFYADQEICHVSMALQKDKQSIGTLHLCYSEGFYQ